MAEKMLRREEAAKYLADRGFALSVGTLAKYAVIGGGPKFSKFGRWPMYAPSELDRWVDAKLGASISSTSEGAAA